MEDPEATVPAPRNPDLGVTASQMAGLMMAVADAFATRPASSGPRGWEPPSVESLQAALPQYEISAPIARGGMGAVYKGTQRALNRAVAIKILPPEMEADTGDLQFAARFKQEAQAMARLSHPNIVAVFDAGAVGNLLYFVMEFIEGTDVAQLIASEGRLDPARTVPIITAVCEALAFAHEEGIVHRDIKPSNIMIDRKGRVKVADFGLAKAVNVESTLMTRSDVAMGTPDFVAPEAMIPGMKVDGRADLYAVGVMLYQMLTGTIPRGRFALPSGVVPQIDKAFDAIIDRAMQTDREKRYPTATEMKTDVERVGTKGEPRSGTGPVPPPPTPGLGKSRSLKLPQLSTAVLFAALGIGGWFLWKGREQPAPEAVSGAASASQGPQSPVATARVWRDALAEEPLKRVVARLKREPQGYVFAPQNHYTFPPTPSVDAVALRWRGELRGDFPTLNLAHDWTPSVEFRVVSGKAEAVHKTSTGLKMLAKSTRPIEEFGADKPRAAEMLLLRLGGRLRLWLDGAEILDVVDPLTGPVQFRYIIYDRDAHATQALDYLPLDGLSEADALKATGLSPSPSLPISQSSSGTETWINALTSETKLASQPSDLTPEGLRLTGNRMMKHERAPKRDGALRMQTRFVPGTQGPQLRVRNAPYDVVSYALNVEPDGSTVLLRHLSKAGGSSNARKLGEYSLLKPLGKGDDYELELRAVGSQLTARFNGQALGQVEDTAIEQGGFGIASASTKPVLVEAVEYLNLDGGTVSQSPPLPISKSPTWRKAITRFEDVPATERAKGTLRWNAGWLEPTSTTQSPPLVLLPGPKVRNGGIRVRGRMSPDMPIPQLGNVFLRRTTGPDASSQVFRAGITAFSTSRVTLVLANDKTKGQETLVNHQLHRMLTHGDEYELELIAIGDELHVRVNDERLPVVTDTRLKEGSLGLHCIHPMRDVEIINLDGLSETEARKAAGLEQ